MKVIVSFIYNTNAQNERHHSKEREVWVHNDGEFTKEIWGVNNEVGRIILFLSNNKNKFPPS